MLTYPIWEMRGARGVLENHTPRTEVEMATQTYWALTAIGVFVALLFGIKSLIVSDARLAVDRGSLAVCTEFKDRAAHLLCSGRRGFGG